MKKIHAKGKRPAQTQTDMSPEERLEANIKRKTRLIRQLKTDALIKAAGFVIAFAVTFTFIFGLTLAPTNDMFPAVHEGDLIISDSPSGLFSFCLEDLLLFSCSVMSDSLRPHEL